MSKSRSKYLLLRIPTVLSLLIITCCSSDEGDSSRLAIAEAKLEAISTFEPRTTEFEGFLGYPYDLDTDENGNIYVLDQKERRVVVLDSKFRFVRAIGREGQGPGEFTFSNLGADAHRLSVRNGLMAVDDSRQTVHLFQTDGTFLHRFRINNDSITDIEITPEGNILIAVLSQENSLWEYTQDGDEVRKYGLPLVQTGLNPFEHRWVFRYQSANQCELEILPDGKVITLGIFWPRLRIYEDGILKSEADLDLSCLVEALPDESSGLDEIIAVFEENPPEAINEASRRGTLSEEYPGRPSMSLLMQFKEHENRLWCQMGLYVLGVSLDGSLTSALRLIPDNAYSLGAHGFGFSGDQIIFSLPQSASLVHVKNPW